MLYPILSDKSVFQYHLTTTSNELELEKYFETTIENNRANKDYPFLVYDKKLEEYAGTTRFYEISPANKSLLIGYTWYGTKFQGTGLNKHCKFLLLQFAFESLAMERVEFRADRRNERSLYAMQSIGCTIEGILRKHIPIADGSRRDTVILSILRDEWFGGIREDLIKKL